MSVFFKIGHFMRAQYRHLHEFESTHITFKEEATKASFRSRMARGAAPLDSENWADADLARAMAKLTKHATFYDPARCGAGASASSRFVRGVGRCSWNGCSCGVGTERGGSGGASSAATGNRG